MSNWFEQSFGNDYLLVYKHRDHSGAREEVKRMVDWLDLPVGSAVFDLCCGMGRHSIALADFGYQVTGLDLSEVLLAEAQKSDPTGRIRWLRGDMRQLPSDLGTFDAVLNLFTSFGYFEEDEDSVKVLQGIERSLRPGGRFIIDFLNAGFVANRLIPHSEREQEGLGIVEDRVIEEGFVRKRIKITGSEGTERNYLEQVKLYGLADFERMLSRTGLRIDAVYGNYAGERYREAESERLILVGHKEVKCG